MILYKINSLDGEKGSSLPLQKLLSSKKGNDIQQVKHVVTKKTLFKFKVLRIRLKISYMAFKKKFTVP
jgi:hypothetical protein